VTGTARRDEDVAVGYARTTLRIEAGWRVLDVGSGHNPTPRADVLLEREIEDDLERGGDAVDVTDPRLVVGDAQAMPFEDSSFDFIIASHIAEHVEQPLDFCSELQRVAPRGYIETPGWFGDRLLREDYHGWRIGRTRTGLRFREVAGGRPFGTLGEAFYVLLYYGDSRPGHRFLLVGQPLDGLLRLLKRGLAFAIRLPLIRDRMYTRYQWTAPFTCRVEWLDGRVDDH
jgi:hypothetical protein